MVLPVWRHLNRFTRSHQLNLSSSIRALHRSPLRLPASTLQPPVPVASQLFARSVACAHGNFTLSELWQQGTNSSGNASPRFSCRCLHATTSHRGSRKGADAWTPKRGGNIILMGSPGAGKTSVGRILCKQLEMKWVDVDDDVLEPTWKMTVAEKLAAIGSKKFIDEEAKAFMNYKFDRAVISLTGSQPMNDDAMAYARSLGLIVYLDVHNSDILQRLYDMKVNRVVGQEGGLDIASILDYRQQFYERHYDVRIICERNEPVGSVTKKVMKAVNAYFSDKGFRSTRSQGGGNSFMDVTVQGLAPDRGLYVSNSDIPDMTKGQWQRLVGLPYKECALRILEQWIPPTEISHKDLRSMIYQAYTDEDFGHKDIAPVVHLEKKQYLLELFHGPTASFKDIPLQLTARLFDHVAKKTNKGLRSLILVATSGDTGGAVLNAFSRHTDTSEVVVLFPETGVSTIQKSQLTSMASPRTCVLGIESDFDYCQTAIKDIFTDRKYNEKIEKELGYSLSAANSINFARLLPQVVYHAWSYLLMVRDGHIDMGAEVDICVPTGNFGNILGAFYAKQMGLPIRHMVVASNSNNVLNEFFTTGVYDVGSRKIMNTLSPAIDILKSSNLERYLYTASGNNYELMSSMFKCLEETGKFSIPTHTELFKKIQRDFTSGWCTDEDSKKTIKSVFQRTGYMIDPHTAVAKFVADQNDFGTEVPLVISATAHFSKFSDGILNAFGIHAGTDNPRALMEKALNLTERPEIHKSLWEDVQLPRHHKTICPPKQEAIRENIESFLNDFYEFRRSSHRR